MRGRPRAQPGDHDDRAAIELRTIHTFLVLADELHFVRTADRVGVTPSRVSQQLRTLERQVGGRLFDRTSRRVSLTPLGARLRDALEPAYRDIDGALRAARAHATAVDGELRVGMYHLVSGGPRWVKIIQTFQDRYPEASVRVIDTGLDRSPPDWLRSGDVDVYALRLPSPAADLVIGPRLSSDPRILITSVRHPLAARPAISYDDVADFPVGVSFGLGREMIDEFVPPSTPSGRPVRRIDVRSLNDTMARVSVGELVYATVDVIVDYFSPATFAAIPITDLPPSETALAWHLSRNTDPSIGAFAATAGDILHRPG